MSILRSIAKKISDYENPNSLGSKFRARRVYPLIELIESVYEDYQYVNIIDVGGRRSYWSVIPTNFLHSHKVIITIINPSTADLDEDDDCFRFEIGDGCCMKQFEDCSFHIVHSNSVIEHVGDQHRIKAFADEVHCLGPYHYIQTPNYWFPIEPHFLTPFFHWLPKRMRIWLVQRFALGHRPKMTSFEDAVRLVESINLLTQKQFRQLFPTSDIITERVAFLPKSLIAIKSSK